MESSAADERSPDERIELRVRREQGARARGFGWVLASITAGAALVSSFLGGEFSALRIAWLASLVFLFCVSLHIIRTMRPPYEHGGFGMAMFGLGAVFAGGLSTAYLGVFSPVPLVVTTGIAFFGQARSPWLGHGVSASVLLTNLALALTFSVEPSWDPGAIASGDLDPHWRHFFVVMVPFVMATTWWQARVELRARLHRIHQLSEALEQAEAATVVKGRFLANMSHEIRTPLNGISGMAALLAEEATEPQNLERVEVIRDSAGALLRILNDVLDSAQLEAGELQIERAPFDLLTVVDGVIGTLGPAAGAKGIELLSRIDARAEGERMGDEGRIRQILLNLVHNGIKFTSAGYVQLEVRPGHGDDLCFTVRDTGRGIECDLRETVFAPFTQADDSRRRKFGGSGLGLAIARRLAERMGGSLKVETTLGEGSSFALTLPLPAPPLGVGQGRPTWSELQDLTVGLRVPAGQLAPALTDWFDQRKSSTPSTESDDAASTKRVRIEAFETERGELRLRIEGPNQDLSTSVGLPLRWGRLRIAIASVLDASSSGQVEPPKSSPTFFRLDAAVLVVDDNEVNLMVARGMLESAGAEVRTADSAAAARRVMAHTSFDLVLMDVQMPELDGLAFTRELRAAGVRTPIVGFTAHADAQSRARCREAGMDGHLAKPVQQKQLLTMVREFAGASQDQQGIG